MKIQVNKDQGSALDPDHAVTATRSQSASRAAPYPAMHHVSRGGARAEP